MPKASAREHDLPLSPGAKTRAEWTAQAAAALVAALQVEKDDGCMIENSFKPQAWARVRSALKSNIGLEVSVIQCKTQWSSVRLYYSTSTTYTYANMQSQLKSRYMALSTLRTLSGFGWNETECRVTATDEMWDAYLKVSTPVLFHHSLHAEITAEAHPKDIWFQKHGFSLYNDIWMLCEGTIATGANAVVAGAHNPAATAGNR